EVIKMYGYQMFDTKNINSPIMIMHSSISVIHNGISKLSDISPFTHMVIMSGSKRNITCDTNYNLIVDESHTCKKWKDLYSSLKCKQFLLLSASSSNEYVPKTEKNKRITIV